jgi:hypothetical protein
MAEIIDRISAKVVPIVAVDRKARGKKKILAEFASSLPPKGSK